MISVLFFNEIKKNKFLVTGINDDQYFYCATARDNNNMCGEEGKYYKKKRVKNTNLKNKIFVFIKININ